VKIEARRLARSNFRDQQHFELILSNKLGDRARTDNRLQILHKKSRLRLIELIEQCPRTSVKLWKGMLLRMQEGVADTQKSFEANLIMLYFCFTTRGSPAKATLIPIMNLLIFTLLQDRTRLSSPLS
jgi:hypothetical protein